MVHQRHSVTPRARHSVAIEFEAVKLRAGQLAAVLRGLEADLFREADAMGRSLEVGEILPDGSTRTTRGGNLSLLEPVCALGSGGHDVGIAWNGDRERYLVLAVRGSRGPRRAGSSPESVPGILIQVSSHDPSLMYRALDGLRQGLGLREVEPQPEDAARTPAPFALAAVPDLVGGERTSAKVARPPAGPAGEIGIRKEHVKGLWALAVAVVSAIAAIIGAYLLKK